MTQGGKTPGSDLRPRHGDCQRRSREHAAQRQGEYPASEALTSCKGSDAVYSVRTALPLRRVIWLHLWRQIATLFWEK